MINPLEVSAVATITMLAVISPGADFAMVTRNSLLHGRRAGLLSSLGIAAGVQLHVFYTMVGVGLLIRSSPDLFAVIKMLGALYLVHVGYKTFTSRPAEGRLTDGGGVCVGAVDAFRQGFFTNALNPKTTLFVLSVYTQVVGSDTPLPIQLVYGAFMSVAHWAWFSLVSVFLTRRALREKLLGCQVWLNRGIGLMLAGLGVMLSVAGS